ncbi:MAG: glycosyltransferase family 4 protein [Candidatus Promineifilaceae bacterium]
MKRDTLKIGLIIYGSLDTVSGGYLYDRKLVQYLRAQGDEIEIISLPWTRYGRHLTYNFSNSLFSRLRSANYDLLLQDELNHPSLFWLNGRLRPTISYPIISIVHHLRSSEAHPPWPLRLYRRVECRYLHSVDGFVCNSRTTKHAVLELLGGEWPFADRSFVVAPPAADHFQPAVTAGEIAARSQEPGPLRILFVGNLIPRKGLHFLVEALSQLSHEDWQLDVVGDTTISPAYTRRIQHQIGAANLSQRISLHGATTDEELAQIYRQHQLLAVPSEYEGFGIVYLEGMGFGLPAIATSAGAAGGPTGTGLIYEGQNGCLVEVGQTAVLARRIHHLHQDRGELTRLSLNARQTYLNWPTWDESMAGVHAFLHQIALSHKHTESKGKRVGD